MTIFTDIIEVCSNQNTNEFTAHEIVDLVVNKGNFKTRESILPSDYCYNRINQGISFKNHAFLYDKGLYKFVGRDFIYSGPIFADADTNSRRVVGYWQEGKFYLWETFKKVLLTHPKIIKADEIGLIEKTIVDTEFDTQVKESLKLTASQRRERLANSDSVPSKVVIVTTGYRRNPNVVAEVLIRANGKCELCDNDAPFKKRNGEPYLEVHHILQLANGGLDTVENAIALCPNCHREKHFGINT